jgi:hypothetical protein
MYSLNVSRHVLYLRNIPFVHRISISTSNLFHGYCFGSAIYLNCFSQFFLGLKSLGSILTTLCIEDVFYELPPCILDIFFFQQAFNIQKGKGVRQHCSSSCSCILHSYVGVSSTTMSITTRGRRLIEKFRIPISVNLSSLKDDVAFMRTCSPKNYQVERGRQISDYRS